MIGTVLLRAMIAAVRGAMGRTILAVVTIALGVALGYAVHAINRSATDELERSLAALSGDADLVIAGPRAGFDEALYPEIVRAAEVGAASPIIELDVRVAGLTQPIKLIGLDALRAGAIQPALVGVPNDDATPLAGLMPDRVFVSPTLAAQLSGMTTLHVQVGLREQPLVIAGTLSGGYAARPVAVMDIAGAQDLFGLGGRLHRIDVRLRPGVDSTQWVTAIRRRLPGDVSIGPPADRGSASARLSRAYRVNLDVLALVALITGGLLVFSMQALAIVRRRSELALLRVLGVTQRQMLWGLMTEAALLGSIGGVLGLALGHALALAVARVSGGDLGAGFFRGIAVTPQFEPVAAIVFFLLGVAASVTGTWLPAREVSRAAPARALKSGDEERALARVAVRWRSPATLIGLGLLLTQAPPLGDLPIPGYVSIALVLAGAIAATPMIGVFVAWRLPLPRNPAARLAVEQLRGAPGQMTVSLAAIVAAVSLAVSMVIMVASFRTSLTNWLDRLLPAELYLRSGGGAETTFLSDADQRAIAAIPGIVRAEFLRVQRLRLVPDRPEVVLLARDFGDAAPADRLPLVGDAGAVPATAIPIWISEQVAAIYALGVGRTLRLPIGTGGVEATVAGVWRDYGRQQGAVVIDRTRYVTLTGDHRANDAGLWLEPGATVRVREALARYAPTLEIMSAGEIRAMSLRTFDRTFAVTYGLEAVAIVIGLASLSASFGALVLARRREFGMLRHLGFTRHEIGAMLGWQGLIVSGLAVVVGFASGAVISLILIHVVNRQSFHWSMDVHWPGVPLVALATALATLAVFTALWSGRRAISIDAVRAVKEDW